MCKKVAKWLKMSVRSVRRIVKEGLGLKAYKFQRRHLKSAASKKKRLDRAKKMFAEIERASRKNIIWSDEKKSLCKLSTTYKMIESTQAAKVILLKAAGSSFGARSPLVSWCGPP